MAEKKIQENPLPEESPMPHVELDKPKDTMASKPPELIAAPAPSRFSIPSFTKTPPNDLYRKLLPAVLFVLTFVTVMTMLLIYMDTVAVGAQQFRVNMSRDYELARIPQASAALVAYVRQLHLAPPADRAPPPAPPPQPTPSVLVLDRLYGEIYNGTFVEVLPGGPRAATTLYLESSRAWSGVACRSHAGAYLALGGAARRVHACLSRSPHPRSVARAEAGFATRVLCLPLYTLLLAAAATRARYVLLAAPPALPALQHVPFDAVALQVIEILMTDPSIRNKTTDFLLTKNYTVAAEFEESIMYALNDV